MAAEQSERSEAAEKALKEIAVGGAPAGTSAQAARQVGGAKESPNADKVLMQQSKAKVEKARMQMEEEKRARAKAERELQRALEEQERLQTLLANAANAGVSDEDVAARKAAAAAARG